MKSIIGTFEVFFILVFSIGLQGQSTSALFPENHLDINEPIGYNALVKFAEIVKEADHVKVENIGKSVENRSLLLFHLQNGSQPGKWKVFFFGQQHGNEPAGKDALIYLIYNIYKNPDLLPDDVELWIMPMVNPDGAEKNQRRNANGFDLNRDHQLLSQPETQIIHRVFRKIMPHVSVDCHEFMRDSRDYDDRGYLEWPLIMMDYCNNPIFSKQILDIGRRWCDDVKKPMQQKGHNYIRYYLGGFPPDDELRHSTPEVDDARNGFGTYGGLSFIIESGIKRKSENQNSDLGKRVDAYLDLFKQFLQNDKHRSYDIEAINKSRSEKMPEFIPTNYFWANKGPKISEVKVIEKNTGNVKTVRTPNFMHDLIVKRSVPAPKGYIIKKKNAELFKTLLNRHAITFQKLNKARKYTVERSKLIRIEDNSDDVYNRYAGRQIVQPDTILTKEFAAGSIFIECDNPDGKRAASLLEPLKLYGIYNNQAFRDLIGNDGIIPVWREIN